MMQIADKYLTNSVSRKLYYMVFGIANSFGACRDAKLCLLC